MFVCLFIINRKTLYYRKLKTSIYLTGGGENIYQAGLDSALNITGGARCYQIFLGGMPMQGWIIFFNPWIPMMFNPAHI